MQLFDQKQKFTITDANGTVISLDSFGVTMRQVQIIQNKLGVNIFQSAEDKTTLIVQDPRGNDRAENNTAMAMLALKYGMELNRKSNETAQNSIKREIIRMRSSGQFCQRSAADKFLLKDAGSKPSHNKKSRGAKIAEKLVTRSLVEVANGAAQDASQKEHTPKAEGRRTIKAEDRNFPLSDLLEDGTLVIGNGKVFLPTPGQKAFLAAYDTNEAIIVDGPAGSGKTEYAIYMALRDLKLGRIDQIVLSGSAQKGEEALGHLPGELETKMNPIVNQMLEKMDRHLGAGNKQEGRKVRERLEAKELIKLIGLADLGGESLERTVLILDEAHQATEGRLNIVIGRGENPPEEGFDIIDIIPVASKIIMCGHSHQNVTEMGASVYAEFWQKFTHPKYAGVVTCLKYSAEDVKRNRVSKIMAELGHDVSRAEQDKAIRDSYNHNKVDQILTQYFNAKASGRIKDKAKEAKLDLYASKLVGQMDMVDLAMQLEANLLSLDKT